MDDANDHENRLAGVLLGTALGDALGLPMEGMSARAVAVMYPRVERFHFLGRGGVVSDDTEQSALVAQSLARHPRDGAAFVCAFRRALLGWFARLPWGIGFGTLRACLRIALGFRRSGVSSAGNGAAMRAAIVGATFFDDAEARATYGRELAKVTHTDARAVEGALFVGELAAACVRAPALPLDVQKLIDEVREPSLARGLRAALTLASEKADVARAARELGTTGFVVHAVSFALFCFLRGAAPLEIIRLAIAGGGDTDSNAAIAGAWAGALHGATDLPDGLIEQLNDGPFGPTHLRALARDLRAAREGTAGTVVPRARYSVIYALARNLALYPVVLLHALRIVASRVFFR